MTTSQLYIYVLTTISTLAIGVIGFWLKKFISDIQADFKTMLSRFDALTGSVALLNTDHAKLSGIVDYMEDRIEKHSSAIMDYNKEIAVLKNELDNLKSRK